MVFWTQQPVTDTEERRQLTQLRLDAQAVAQDSGLNAIFKTLINLKEAGQLEIFHASVLALKEPRITRLVQYEGDLGAALQGGYAQLVTQCESMRDLIDQRLWKAVLGDGVEIVPQRQQIAFRHARLGRLTKVRLFHLWNEDDNGTAERPLKQLENIDPLSRRGSIALAFHRLQSILQLAFPAQQAEITIFFPCLSGKLCQMCDKRLPIPSIEKWLNVIIHLVVKPIERLAVGDATVGVEPRLALEMSSMGMVQDHNAELAKDELKHMADNAGGSSSSATTAPNNNKQLKRQNQQLMEQVALLKSKAQKGTTTAVDGAATSNEDRTWAAVDEALDCDEDGKYDKMVGKGHPVLDEWNKQYPRKNNKFTCWAHSNHVDGCVLGKKCKATHLE